MKYNITFLALFLVNGAFSQNYHRSWTIQKNSKKERIALIIANNHYESKGSLLHPIPTSIQLETTLKSMGFDVLVGRDLNRKQMRSILNDFSKKYKNYQFAMVSYMGHGFEIDGKNYLIPVDANPNSKDEVANEALDVEYILKKVNNPNIPKLIIFDACRNNPFVKNWTSSERAGIKNGFTDINAPKNATIYFTTQKNSTVLDDNPFMNYFMEAIEEGGCFDNIKRTVYKRVQEYNQNLYVLHRYI